MNDCLLIFHDFPKSILEEKPRVWGLCIKYGDLFQTATALHGACSFTNKLADVQSFPLSFITPEENLELPLKS